MVIGGVVRNGLVVPDRPLAVSDGTRVQIEVAEAATGEEQKRRGGWWRGQVKISPDFDQLPEDVSQAFGMDET